MRARSIALLTSLLVACVTERDIGQLPANELPDAGADSRELDALRDAVVGTWCGRAYSEDSSLPLLSLDEVVPVEVAFDEDGSYRVRCSCEHPFPGELVPDGARGRYRINEITFDGLGWGRVEDPLVNGGTQRLLLERIRFDEQGHLRMERRAARGLAGVWLDLGPCSP